jgi:hypothetical protein
MKRKRIKNKPPITDIPPGAPGEKLQFSAQAKAFIGIDPGKTGFICKMSEDGIEFSQVPKIGTKVVDLLELSRLIESFQGLNCHCVIEDVHAIYGSSAGATFEFGRVVGNLESFLVAYRIPHTRVAPKKWQKEMWQGVPVQKKKSKSGKTMTVDTKKMSEIAAKRLFPDVDLRKSTRAKNPDDNKVDSLLMAEYCRRKF